VLLCLVTCHVTDVIECSGAPAAAVLMPSMHWQCRHCSQRPATAAAAAVTFAAAACRCLACSSADTYSADCEYCALESDPAAAAACYNCSAALQRSNGTNHAFCSGCLSLTDSQDKQQCLECLASAAISSNAKQWCLGCANTSDKGKCFECLGQQLGDGEAYRAACLMTRSPDSPKLAQNDSTAVNGSEGM
jgi:hypothetical protein